MFLTLMAPWLRYNIDLRYSAGQDKKRQAMAIFKTK
jgi:hypothetical protein